LAGASGAKRITAQASFYGVRDKVDASGFSLIEEGSCGGRAGTRSPDLLRVKQTDFRKLLITGRIFAQEKYDCATKVRLWVGCWVGCLSFSGCVLH
jgi:hypothetical protein